MVTSSDPTKVTVTVTLDGETPVVYTKDIAAFTGDGSLSAANSDGSSTSWERFSSKGLFEALVRTLAEDTGKLRSVKRLVDDLHRADAVVARNVEIDGAPDTDREPIVPRGFDEVWEPIWQAAVELGVHIPSEREHGVSDA